VADIPSAASAASAEAYLAVLFIEISLSFLRNCAVLEQDLQSAASAQQGNPPR
jgi:hypothetical protein